MVKLLLDYGTDANAQLVRGWFRSKEFDTVLHAGIWAQDWDKKSIVPLLLANGADVNAWPRGIALNGGSPLMYAVQLGCATAITQLLKAGADPNVGSTKGYVPLHIAVQRRVLDLLNQVLAVSRDETSIQINADPNLASLIGSTPLHYAASMGWGQSVELLIAAGADPMRMTLYGETYLHLASMDETLYMQLSQPCTPVDLIGRERYLKHSLCQPLRSKQCHALGINISNQQEIHQLRYNVLGHCLLRLGHHGEARIALSSRSIISRSSIASHAKDAKNQSGAAASCATPATMSIYANLV